MQQNPPDTTAQRLASLFEEHLNISEKLDAPPFTDSDRSSISQMLTAPSQSPATTPIKYSITQHYHHSSHTTPSPTPTPHPTPSLHPLHPHRDNHTLRLLIQNDIPPSSLLRSQLALFENSSVDEQAKLMMLWRLAPPTYARHGGQQLADRLGEYQSITLAQEEELTWLRYQRNFARGDVKTDVQVERLCGRESVLGEYFDARGIEHRPPPTGEAAVRDDEDEEML